MIDDPPILDVARTIRRPSAALVDAFRGVPTGFVVDAMAGRGALDASIKPMPGTPAKLVGVALTCDNGPADNLALCAAVAQCEPGDVLVAATDSFRQTAVVGDLVLVIAKNRGAAGFVTDGLVRDQADIETLAFPCFAAGATPNSPARNGPGSVGLPIICGGRPVRSGDVIVADRDGVVVVPQDEIEAVIERLEAVRQAEAKMYAAVHAGQTRVPFVEPLFAGGRVRYRD